MSVKLRTDHLAGAGAILAGAVVYLISGDLPIGSASFPGAGMLPKLLCGALVILGIVILFGAAGSQPASEAGWSDLRHAVPVLAIAAVATALFTQLGFIVSMIWAWRHRSALRAKTKSLAGRFSLWFPLAATLPMAVALIRVIPPLFGGSMATLRLFLPDLAWAMIASAATGVAWAVLRLGLAYSGTRSAG